jgi:diacylglycerol kinase (ATP)
MDTVHLLVNPARARRAAVNTKIRQALESRGRRVIELRPPSIDAIAATIDAARDQALDHTHADQPPVPLDRLVIAGGDGLVHHALPALADTKTTVGIVSVGTGNDFARALGLPTRIEPAVDAALAEPTPIDLIASSTSTSAADPDPTDWRYAASVVTGGFSGAVNHRANQLGFPPGQQRYTVATLLELPRLEPTPLRLALDGGAPLELSATLFAIGNSRFFGGGMAICPTADPTDGLLHVTVVGPTSRFVLARMLPTVFSGRHVNHPAVTTYQATTVDLATDAPLWADGERFGGVSLRPVPGALLVAGTLVGV